MRPDLATRRLRTSARFTLLGFDELDAAEQRRLAALREDPDFYGILRPADARVPPKAISRDAALLLLALQRPQRVPALLASLFGDRPERLFPLLADGVLEVEHDGAFISGPVAVALFSNEAAPAATTPLSARAIEAAASFEGLDAAALARKVYAFGRLPCTAAIRRRFAEDVFLSDVPDVYRCTTDSDDDPWLAWSARAEPSRLECKLYVSARAEAMPRVFPLAARALARARCERFKVARRGEGMCRPDKMVAYFASLDHLHECAGRLEEDLRAADPREAHGVPFAAPIDAAGFLSWGTDPPRLDAGMQSWRSWIASRVAVAVLSAKAAGVEVDVVPFVLSRLELDGIDTRTWAPSAAIWRAHAENPEDVA